MQKWEKVVTILVDKQIHQHLFVYLPICLFYSFIYFHSAKPEKNIWTVHKLKKSVFTTEQMYTIMLNKERELYIYYFQRV